ncbi:hypothetical protein [Isoptericola sp. NPDC055881]
MSTTKARALAAGIITLALIGSGTSAALAQPVNDSSGVGRPATVGTDSNLTKGDAKAARRIAEDVFAARDPEAAYDALDADEQALFVDANTLAVVEETSDAPVEIPESEAKASFELAGYAVQAATKYDVCYSRSAQGAGKNLLGGVLYRYYTTIKYCAKGGVIKKATWSNRTGKPTFPGWYYDGRGSSQFTHTAASVRGYQQFKFRLGPIKGAPIQNRRPCLQTRVNKAGKATTSGSCYA